MSFPKLSKRKPKNRNQKLTRLGLLLSLLLFTLACTIHLGGPEYPDTPIPVSTEAVEALQEEVKAAMEAATENGVVTLTVSETQLTSFLAFKLASQETPLFTNPQVYLRDEQMKIYGQVQKGSFVANIAITVSVGVDEKGQPEIKITEADFGPFPVPEGLTESLSAFVKEAYAGAIGPAATGFRLEAIAIGEGFMVLQGRIK